MTQKILRIVFSCILSLFIAIFSLFGILCHYAQNYVCNQDVLLQTCTESGFTQQLYEEIRYEWENLMAITGITESDDVMSVLTLNVVQADVLQYFQHSYSGSSDLQTDTLRAQLDQKIRDYAYSHNVEEVPVESLEQNIVDLVDACMSVYTGSVSIPMLPRFLGTVNTLGSYLRYGMLLAAAGTLIFLLFLFFLQRNRQDTLYYATISIGTCGVLLVGLMHLISHYEVLARLPVSESALKTIITSYLQLLLDKLEQYGYQALISAGILLAVYLLICCIVAAVKKRHSCNHAEQ